MKPHDNTHLQRLLTLLATAFLMMSGIASAQDPVQKTSEYVQVECKEQLFISTSLLDSTNQVKKSSDMDLLDELIQTDSSDKTEPTALEKQCDPVESALDTTR